MKMTVRLYSCLLRIAKKSHNPKEKMKLYYDNEVDALYIKLGNPKFSEIAEI